MALMLGDKEKLKDCIEKLQELSDNKYDTLSGHIYHLEVEIDEKFILCNPHTASEKSELAYDNIPIILKDIVECLKNKEYTNEFASPKKYIKIVKNTYNKIFGHKLVYRSNYKQKLYNFWNKSLKNNMASFYVAILCSTIFCLFQCVLNEILYSRIDQATFNALVSNTPIVFGSTFLVDQILNQFFSNLINKIVFGKYSKLMQKMINKRNIKEQK